jgi:hypothetical protein
LIKKELEIEFLNRKFLPFLKKNGLFDLSLIKDCFKWELVFGSSLRRRAGPINPVSGIQPMKKENFDGKYDIVRDGIMTKWVCVCVQGGERERVCDRVACEVGE